MPAQSRFLRYFVAVARHGSIRRASDELRIAASAIDRQIQLGEESFQTRLFDRLPSGMRLTAAGELLLRQAREWTAELELLHQQFDDLKGLRRGCVRVAAIDALAKGRLPLIIASLMAAHPRLTTQLMILDNKDVAAAVVGGNADLGLMLNPSPSRDLSIQIMGAFPIGFVVPVDHPLVGRDSAPASAGAEEPIVAPDPPLALHEQVGMIEAITGVVFNRVATSDSIQMVKSLIREKVGIGILCALDVADEVERGELAFIRIACAALPPLTLAMCSSRSRQLSAPARLMMRDLDLSLLSGGREVAGDAI